MHRIFIGFDPREADAFAVARSSIRRHMPPPRDMEIRGVVLDRLLNFDDAFDAGGEWDEGGGVFTRWQ